MWDAQREWEAWYGSSDFWAEGDWRRKVRPRVSEPGEDAAVAAVPRSPSTPPPAAMIGIMNLQQAYVVDTHPLVDADMRIKGASYPREDGKSTCRIL